MVIPSTVFPQKEMIGELKPTRELLNMSMEEVYAAAYEVCQFKNLLLSQVGDATTRNHIHHIYVDFSDVLYRRGFELAQEKDRLTAREVEEPVLSQPRELLGRLRRRKRS